MSHCEQHASTNETGLLHQVNERVVIDRALMGWYYGSLSQPGKRVKVLDTSKPITEDEYLSCSGHVAGYLLDTQEEAAGLALSRLRPVEWDLHALRDIQVPQKEMVADLVGGFSPHQRLMDPTRAKAPPPRAGLVF